MTVGTGVFVFLIIMRVLVGDGVSVALNVGIKPGVSSGDTLSAVPVPGPIDSEVMKAAVAGGPVSMVAPAVRIAGIPVAPSGVSSSPSEPPKKNNPPRAMPTTRIITMPTIINRAIRPRFLFDFAGGGATAACWPPAAAAGAAVGAAVPATAAGADACAVAAAAAAEVATIGGGIGGGPFGGT